MQEKKKTLLIFTTSILILMVIVLTASLINFIISKTTYYKISPRVKNMEKYSENNKNMPAIGWIRVQGTNIDYPINIKATFYVPDKRKRDLTNLENAIADILVKYKVIADDNYNIIAGWDGSRIIYEKDRMETILEIKEV